MRRLPRICQLFVMLPLAWAGHAAATTVDDAYLQCDPFLVTVETSWSQRLGNWWRSVGADEVAIGLIESEGERRVVELRPITGQVYPDRIEFQRYSTDYTIDRAKLQLSWESTNNLGDRNGEVSCTIVSKTEFQSLLRQYDGSDSEVEL